jgi:DNA-binding transcriptional MerR regulator
VEGAVVSKGPDAFRTISEAAAEVGVPQHVLRFWETKFSFIRPMKRAGGRRFYRPQDLMVLRGVRRLLHDEGYTIMGVQRLHRDHGTGRLVEAGGGEPSAAVGESASETDSGFPHDVRSVLSEALASLSAAKARLDSVLGG